MKKLLPAALIAVTLFTASCNDDASSSTSADKKDTMATADNTMATQDTSMANNSNSADPAKNDSEFAKNAADGGMTEVKLSEVALKNGTAAVKELANMMIMDHTKGNDELKGLAQKSNIELPAALSAKNQQKVDNLSAKKGADADKLYLDLMESDHKETIALFQTEASGGMNADIKPWAAGKVPAFQGHLQMVMDVKAKKK